MKKIICPTDFSETADNGIVYAAKLAQRTGASLTLFHVESLMEHTLGEAVMGETFNVQAATQKLAAQCEQIRQAFHISVACEVQATGRSVIAEIADQAARHDCVVMGSEGPHDLVQFLIGSHTYRTLRQVQRPLLLVPAGYGYSEVRQLVFAYDYLKNGKLPLKQLLAVTAGWSCKITVLQVCRESYTRAMEEKMLSVQQQIRHLFPTAPLVFDTVYASEVVATLHSYVQRNAMDLLALCTKDYPFMEGLFHKSTIKAMSVIASYPVLITHE
ncbi:MAG: universal stress protein [Bacteroidota bacterium]